MANLKMSRAGAKELIGHEGIVLTRYLDSKNIWTIGVGHTKAAGPPDPKTFDGKMTLPEVIDLFMRDLGRYEKGVNDAIKVDLTQTEFDALVSFHFNTGTIAKAALTTSINAGNKAKAALEFMNWSKPPEIKPRRAKEQKLFRDGVYSNGGKATQYPASAAGKVDFTKGVTVDLTGL